MPVSTQMMPDHFSGTFLIRQINLRGNVDLNSPDIYSCFQSIIVSDQTLGMIIRLIELCFNPNAAGG